MEESSTSQSSKSSPPPGLAHRTLRCIRPIMRSHHLLLVVSLVIPEAIAYVSSVEILANDVPMGNAAQLHGVTDSKNVALHRPCQPAPLCSNVVDGNKGTFAILDNGHGLISSFSGEYWQHTPKFQDLAPTFKVFLQQHVYVSHVVVLCSGSRSSNLESPLRGTLFVTTWVGDQETEGRADADVTIKTNRILKDIVIAPSEPGQAKPLRVEFQVDSRAGAVSVEWQRTDKHDTDNTTLQINEIMVMADSAAGYTVSDMLVNQGESPDVDSDSDSPAMEAPDIIHFKTRLWTRNGSTKQNHSLSAGDDKAEARGNYGTAEVAAASPVDMSSAPVSDSSTDSGSSAVTYRRKHRTTMGPKTLGPQAVMHTTLSTSSTPKSQVSMVASAQESELSALPPSSRDVEFLGHSAQSQRTALGYNAFILSVLALISVAATAIVPRLFYSQCFLWLRKGAVYQALELEDPEAPSFHDEEQPSGLRHFFNIIGHRDEQESPRFTRRPHLLQQSTPPLTESEPEGELEPLIPSDGNRVLLQGLEPPPAMLGMPEASSSQGGKSDMFLAQCSRRVVLMYSSPLCYMSQAQRPTPLPQIPFEREWEVIVQARDEANAALRVADQGHGRLSRRRSTAALEAQPLTAASLRRLVAPSPEPTRGGAAAVLHLSAHGIQDCLVAENGKTTAHFLSCSVIREMLAGGSEGNAAPVRLVVLNACSLHMLGDEFVSSGAPHVICSSAELRDSASHVFLCALYSSLFQGGTVKHAFSSALVALRSDPEASTRSAAKSFCLLPDQAPHDEVIFWPAAPLSTNVRPTSVAASSAPVSAPDPAACKRESSGASTCAGSTSTSSESAHASSNSFLITDNAESSNDGVDESCGSEGHADTSSANGSSTGHDGSDSDGSATENSSLLSPSKGTSAAETPLPDTAPVTLVPAGARRRIVSTGRPVPRRSTFGCARRPVRQEVMVPRKLALQRSLVTLPSEASLSPFTRAVPPVPEDFIGRSVDVWSVLQHLGERRAVVVCGESDTDHGIGKSAVLDAVHRAFALQMGGVCVPVHLRALSDADVVSATSAVGWINKVTARVQSVLEEYQDLWRQAEGGQRPVATTLPPRCRSVSCLGSAVLGNGALRRRKTPARISQHSVSRGFHLLSDPILVESALDELVVAMSSLRDLCQECNREWTSAVVSPPHASGVRILLLLDECDHLIQQRHFQDAIAAVLRRCESYSVVLSTQQPMVETGGGWFKAVHQPVGGLVPKDAARLFLRRTHRPLYWDELLMPMSSSAAEEPASSASATPAASSSAAAVGARRAVVMTRDNESEVLARVAAHPAVAAQKGNPRRLIELASQVRAPLASLSELAVLRQRGAPEEV